MLTYRESEKEELLKQYESQLQDLQKELLIDQKEQQHQLKLRLDLRRADRNRLAVRLEKIRAQKAEMSKLIDGQIEDVDISLINTEKKIDDDANNEKKNIEGQIERKKNDALKQHQDKFDKKLKRTSESKKRTELLEELEKGANEIEELFEKDKAEQMRILEEQINLRVKMQKEEVRNNAIKERAVLKEQKNIQLGQLIDMENLILNKLGNVAIDEKLTEAVEADRMKSKEEEDKYEKEKAESMSKIETIQKTEKERLAKIREDISKEEDLIREDYEVQKRIVTNAIKKQCEDIQKAKEIHQKQLNQGLMTAEDEEAIKEKMKKLDEQLAQRIEVEVGKQEEQFKAKLLEKKRLRSQKEADIKESCSVQKSAIDKEWIVKDQELRESMRKDKLNRLIEELKTRTKEEELPIAVENVIETVQFEELTDLLAKQYKEKALILNDKISDHIQNKLIEMHKLKEDMHGQFMRLKEAYEKEEITSFDYERRLRDLQSRESDQIRDIELIYIQKQNDLQREVCGSIAEKQEQELLKLREDQMTEKNNIIADITSKISLANPQMKDNFHAILGGQSADGGKKELEDYKDQLKAVRIKKLKELDDRRMRLQNIAIENEEAIKRFNEGTRKMLNQQAIREKEREEKRKGDIEKLKNEHESKLKSQEGFSEEEKKKLLEEYNQSLQVLTNQMETEQKRQASKKMEKLQARMKEKDLLNAQKQIQLSTYKKEVNEKMENMIKEAQIKIETKVEVKDVKSKINSLTAKYDTLKTVFDKKKKLEGVENIDELEQITNIEQLRDKETGDEIEGALTNIDFDGLYEKISTMERRVGDFSEEQFHKLIEGFRIIYSTLNELKESAEQKRLQKYKH